MPDYTKQSRATVGTFIETMLFRSCRNTPLLLKYSRVLFFCTVCLILHRGNGSSFAMLTHYFPCLPPRCQSCTAGISISTRRRCWKETTESCGRRSCLVISMGRHWFVSWHSLGSTNIELLSLHRSLQLVLK